MDERVAKPSMPDVGRFYGAICVLEQFDCTTVICPGQIARVDEWRNLIVKEHTS